MTQAGDSQRPTQNHDLTCESTSLPTLARRYHGRPPIFHVLAPHRARPRSAYSVRRRHEEQRRERAHADIQEAMIARSRLLAAQHDQRVMLERDGKDARNRVRDRDDALRLYVPQRLRHVAFETRGRGGKNRDDLRLRHGPGVGSAGGTTANLAEADLPRLRSTISRIGGRRTRDPLTRLLRAIRQRTVKVRALSVAGGLRWP